MSVLVRSSSLLERMFVLRSLVHVLLVTLVFSHLARSANNNYGNGGLVKTGINIRQPDKRARSHAGPQEYLTRYGVIIVNKTRSFLNNNIFTDAAKAFKSSS